MAVKYYAVAVGKKPGIYTKWDECKAMVHGFPGAVYKSFKTLEEAETFLESAPARGGEAHAKGAAQQKATQGAAQQKSGTAGDGKAETRGAESAGETEDLPENYAFVDGSFHAGTGVYGYGGFLIHAGGKEVLQGAGKEPEMASMRNVAGEIKGSEAAMRFAKENGYKKLAIHYDYEGIQKWCTGEWAAKKEGTQAYQRIYEEMKQYVQIKFVKVKGHSNDKYNDYADMLAKSALEIGDGSFEKKEDQEWIKVR